MSDGDDPFERISAELAGSGGSAPPAGGGGAPRPGGGDEDETHVAPVPAGAPPPPKHPKKGEPSARWTYRDGSGGVLGYVERFDTADGKEVLPLTLWRTSAGVLRWRRKAPPPPRPLYGLRELALRPKAPVLVVEGEKAADAAARLFPDLVAVTWPGGCKAAAKADWRSLAGRAVTIWPDADDAGREAAGHVRDLALRAGAASAGIVELPPLLPQGWDLADAWLPAFGAAAARAAIDAAGEASETTIWPRGYQADASGLWWQPPAEKDEPPPRVFICGPLRVVAVARDEEGMEWSIIVEFRDPDSRVKREIIGRGELAGEGTEVRRRLMSAGLAMATGAKARERLQAALAGVVSSERARLASSTGWKGELYVLPHRTIGAGQEQVLYRGRVGGTNHGAKGDLAAWRDQVAAPAVGNALLTFALSAAFAGPLLRLLGGAEGGGFHIRGSSSTGKTTLLRAAGSVWGGGGELGFAQSWRNTDNALEAVALAHNDGLLALDEMRQLDPSAAGAAAYALSAGVSKGRLRADAELRPRPTWRVMILSAGEIGLGDLIRLAPSKDKTYAGQELRLIDLDADMGAGMGAWQRLHTADTPAGLSQALRAATDAHYGHAGPLFVERLLADRARLVAACEAHADEFCRSNGLQDDTGQARRAANRFGIVAAAGELARELDVVPWPPGEAVDAAGVLFRRWAASFGRAVEREDQEAVERIRAFIGRYEHSRFRWLKDALSDADHAAEDALTQAAEIEGKFREGEARSMDAAGWKGNRVGDGLVFYFPPEFWRDELFAGMDARHSAKALKSQGLLLTQGEESRLTCRVRVSGGSPRTFYAISHRIMEG